MTVTFPTRLHRAAVMAFALIALPAAAENPKAPPKVSTSVPAPLMVGAPDLVLVSPMDQAGSWPGFTGIQITYLPCLRASGWAQ